VVYPWSGEFLDLSDFRVRDDVMKYHDLGVHVDYFLFEWTDVEDWFVTSVLADQLSALRTA